MVKLKKSPRKETWRMHSRELSKQTLLDRTKRAGAVMNMSPSGGDVFFMTLSSPFWNAFPFLP